MIKSFPIDFVRQTLEQKLFEEHCNNANLYGGKDQVSILSFYEQLKSQEEVDRFVEIYRDLTEQQNRTGLILNGTLVSAENPTITNLYSSLIIPMTWTCSLRTTLENRDQSIITINNLIEKLKGKKVDIAQLECVDEKGRIYYKPFIVGTLGQNSGTPTIKNGDFIGTITSLSDITTILGNLTTLGMSYDTTQEIYLYVDYQGKIKVVKSTIEVEDNVPTTTWDFYNDEINNVIAIPPQHNSYERYKLSLSFDAIRCDEPRNLNEQEYCELTFSGSATLVSNGIALGNDLLKISMSKKEIKANSTITFTNATIYWLEPLELPSGSNVNTKINQLVSNKFLSNTHSDALSLTLQYTFMLDRNIELLNQLYKYARYGTQGITANDISPNMIFNISEIWCSWGQYEKQNVIAKIVENIDIENTESDALTLSLTMQIQGAN